MSDDQIYLNKKQLLSLELFNNGYNLFITGGAGTGKSFLTNMFKTKKDTRLCDIVITSTTGISALNIGGITIHTWAGIDHQTDTTKIDEFVHKIQNNYNKLNNYLYTKTLIIDEISMLDCETFDFINDVCKRVRKNNEPFGGIQVVFTGDFYQLPPVSDHGFAFESKCWENTIDYTIILKEIYRQQEPVLINILNKIREGNITPAIEETLQNLSNTVPGKNYTHLYSNKFNVDVTNLVELDKINGDILEYLAPLLCKMEE